MKAKLWDSLSPFGKLLMAILIGIAVGTAVEVVDWVTKPFDAPVLDPIEISPKDTAEVVPEPDTATSCLEAGPWRCREVLVPWPRLWGEYPSDPMRCNIVCRCYKCV